METNTTEYYNAKPSNIGNLGLDVAGAKRHNFDTYESTEERAAKKQKNSSDKVYKEAFKAVIFAESVDKDALIALLVGKFKSDYDLDNASYENLNDILIQRRQEIMQSPARVGASEYNKLWKAYHALNRTLRDIKSTYYFDRYIAKMQKRYSAKDSFIDQTGKVFNWKEFKQVTDIDPDIEYLKNNSKAVQFGNSVSDKERAYILQELARFIAQWQVRDLIKAIDISQISWSFGARGKAGSVAYYVDAKKLISVNRNNIGSLVHELGHYIDAINGHISNKISWKTLQEYEKTLPEDMSWKQKRYYCSRVEIFARAFEAYCLQKAVGFSDFAQCGKAYLPDLNDELIGLIEECLKLR
jgi:hypothetical protein